MSDEDSDKTSIKPLSELMASAQGESQESAYLIVLSGKAVGKMFKVAPGEMLIGRSAACDILLDDDGVSRKHARIICRPDGSVALLDLGSTNGTWVEGQKVDLRHLSDGDRIQIGSATILKYGYQDTVEEKFVSQLYESATQDGLTGVYNKRFFLDRLDQEFAWHRRHGQALSLILFDIDYFKHINDTFGHQPGDFVLKRLAKVALQQCRTEDIFARYGGEEFAVILRQTSSQEGTVLAERIRRTVEGTVFEYSGDEGRVKIPVTISLGVASLSSAMGEPANLIELADRYLYKSKQGGRNRVSSQAFDG
jgi:two-component system, cell cycle response regulator